MKKPIKPSGMETSKLAIVVFVVLIPIMRLLFVKSGVSFSEIMGNLVDTSENEAIWLVAIIVSGALAMSIGTIKHYIAMERYKAEVEKHKNAITPEMRAYMRSVREAAKNGDIDAQFNLGSHYNFGNEGCESPGGIFCSGKDSSQ